MSQADTSKSWARTFGLLGSTVGAGAGTFGGYYVGLNHLPGRGSQNTILATMSAGVFVGAVASYGITYGFWKIILDHVYVV